MRTWRRIAVGAAVAVAVSGIATAVLWPSGQTSSVAVGKVALLAPGLRKRLPNLSGAALLPPPARLSLRSARPEVIDVWASWCLPCQQEAPMLARLWRRHKARVRFIGIDVEDARGAATRFSDRYAVGYPSIFDPGARLAVALAFFGLPTVYLVDRHGRIALTLIGKHGAAGLTRAVELLVEEDSRNARSPAAPLK